MSGKRRRFTDEFKLEAVRLVTEQGLSVAQASRDLGVSESVLGRWKQQEKSGLLGETPKRRELDEIRQLKKELAMVKMERDILKKAAAYFAKGSL